MNDIFWWWFDVIILTASSAYITIFLLVVPLGSAIESVSKWLKKESIVFALTIGLEVSYTETEMSKCPPTCNHTLGGIIDEMVRSKEIIRTPSLEPIPRWIITRHPQLR